MSAVVILGLKIPFRALWEKVGLKERPMCACPETPSTFMYCPHCGVRKQMRKIKVYRSKLTGEESTYRNLDPIADFLHKNEAELYDVNPRGYTDEPVYIYFTNPQCCLQISQTDPVSMAALKDYPFELEDWLYDLVGKDLWDAGEFGLWAFLDKSTTENPQQSPAPQQSPPQQPPLNNDLRTFIIPLGPRLE